MPGTKYERKTYATWALQRISNDEDERNFWAFILHVQKTGGDITRIGDYGWPNSITIAPPPVLPKELPA